MKKFQLLLLSILITSSLTFSQSKFNAGASFNVGFPVSGFNELAKTGVGVSLIGEYAFSQKVSALLSLAYQTFGSNISDIATGGSVIDLSFSSIPILAGVRYYFAPEVFGTIEAGAHYFRVNADISDIYNKERISTDYELKFGGGIGGGYRFRLADASVLELIGVYQYVDDELSSISARLAVLILFDNL